MAAMAVAFSNAKARCVLLVVAQPTCPVKRGPHALRLASSRRVAVAVVPMPRVEQAGRWAPLGRAEQAGRLAWPA